MENNVTPRGPVAVAIVLHLPTFPVLVAKLGGRVVAFCERHVAVRSLVGLPGTVRWVGADGVIGVHLDHAPLAEVTEYPRDMIAVTWGGITLCQIEGYLATNPPVAADLDRAVSP
jgi:hypothetical protein